MTKKVGLQVNGNPITLDYFVQSFVDHTVRGMIESLENTEPVEQLVMTIDDGKVTILLNGKNVSANAFVGKIFTSTVAGMVAPLKGVTAALKTARIEIEQ